METTNYKRGGDAGSKGVQFQVSLLTVCLLNAFRRRLNSWRLSTENKRAGKFDDVVLEWSEGVVLVQAKCKEKKSKKITMENLMSVNPRHDDFSLPKYFLSYQEIKGNFSVKNIVVCTNIGMDHKALKYVEYRRVCPQSMLYYEDNSYMFYTFKDDILLDLKENVKNYLEINLKNKDLNENVITEENLRDFLKHLHFYTSYPSGRDLKKFVEQILTRMNLSSTISYSDVYAKVLDWFQQKNGMYLNATRARAIFSEIWTDKHFQLLRKYNVHFKCNDFNFNQKGKQIFHITGEGGYLLREIKIYHNLQSDKNTILYVNSADDVEVQKEAVKAFNLPNYTILIIVLRTPLEKSVVDEICDILRGILDNYKYKKVILVADNYNKLLEQIHCGNGHHDIIDGTVQFKDFVGETQEKILKTRNIEFQGKYVSLEELFETQGIDYYEKIINPEILEILISNENIRVGREVKDISRYYISRTFVRNISENQNEKDIVSEENMYELVTDKMILITDSAGMGKSTVLVKMAVVIKQRNPRLWVIRIELSHHTSYFKELLRNGKMINIMELLHSNNAAKSTNHLENLAFTLHEKIVLMLDGVDEISPDYTDLVVNLLVRCRNMPNFAKVFVTSRPHMTELLEKKLHAKSFMLQRFTEQNQIDFLTDYWAYNLGLDEVNKERSKQYAKILISKIDKDAIFTAIPLQVKMMAEIFQQNNRLKGSTVWVGCKEYLSDVHAEPKLQKNLNITKLYELFIEKKRDVFVEKSNPTGNPAANQALVNQFKECLIYHRSLALEVILYTFDAELFASYREVVEDIEEIILKIGIVQKDDDDELHFPHRTFAEYFVAEAIVQELQHRNQNLEFQTFFINNVLLENEFKVVRSFLNHFLQKVVNSLPPYTLQKYKSAVYDNHWLKSGNFHLIHYLAREGHTAILHLLLKCINFKIVRDQEINIGELYEADGDDEIPMHIFSNTLTVLEFLLHRGGVNIRNECGETPLRCAVVGGHFEMVKFLLEQGASMNSETWDDSSLNYAIRHGHFEIIKFLMEQQENIGYGAILQMSIDQEQKHVANYFLDKVLEEGTAGKEQMLAYAAAYLGRLDILKNLVEQGSNVNGKIEKGKSAIFGAVQGKQLDIITYLVEQGADINARDDFKNTSLHAISFQSSFLPTVKLLVALGIDINARDLINDTALHKASTTGNFELVKVLVEAGADLNSKDAMGRTPIAVAASMGHLNILEILAKSGGDINTTDSDGNTTLHLAVNSEDLDTVTFFTSRDVDVNIRNDQGQTALHIAASRGNEDMVDFLVKLGLDFNVRDREGQTALHLAAHSWPHMIKLLVRLGLDVNAPDDHGRTPLHLACKDSTWSCIAALFECNAEVEVPDNYGRTPLFHSLVEETINFNSDNTRYSNRNYAYSRFLDKLDIVSWLVHRYGANINARDHKGRTILHEVASRGQWYTVQLLIVQLKADVNVRDIEGRTPLHLAAETGAKIVKFLVTQGAYVGIEDFNGDTAADLARQNGHSHLLEYLTVEDTIECRRILCCLKRCDF